MNPFSSSSPSPSPNPSKEEKNPKSIPSPQAAVAVFGAALVLNFAIGYLFAALGWDTEWLLVVTPLVLLALTAAAVAMLGVDIKETLLLRRPSASDVLMAVPLALSLVVLNDQLSTLTQSLVELPEELEAGLRELLLVDSPAAWVFKLATIGLGAALSEELLFRGFIQNAFLGSMRRLRAIIWTAILFMILHTLPLPSFAAAGIVLGIAALGSRSIVVPVVVHFVNNASSLALVNVSDLDTLADPLWTPPSILLPALAIFVISIAYFVRRMPDLVPAAAGQHRSHAREADAGSDAEIETRSEPDSAPIALSVPSPSISDELAGVSPARRRLGWLVVAVSLVFGLVALLSLIIYSFVSVQPEGFQRGVIEVLEQRSVEQLAPDASHRAGELRQAYATLGEVNDRGELPFRRLWGVLIGSARAMADSRIDDAEVDVLLAVIRQASGTTDAPRKL